MGEARKEYPVVMRMQGLWPENIGGFEKHRLRDGGDVGHVDAERSVHNQRLLGEANWAQLAHQEIRQMKLENHARELAQLEKRRRTRELQRRLAEGPKDPWRATRHGPMREIILTAHADWFKATEGDPFDEKYETREAAFQRLGAEWLEKAFGEDCVHARADRDETTFHIHAVILPRAVTRDGRRMLQPSKHDVIRNYEKGQDDVGTWFAAADIGLTRGERRKKKVRNAIEFNAELRDAQKKGDRLEQTEKPIPKHRQHVSPRKWREARECELVEREAGVRNRETHLSESEAGVAKREQIANDKEREADEVLSVAQAVADGDLSCEEDDPAKDDMQETTPSRPALALRLFGKALARLRRDEKAAARAELKDAFDEVRQADAAIVRIANLLPMKLRKQVASARTSLTRSIMALTSHLSSKQPVERDEPPRE